MESPNIKISYTLYTPEAIEAGDAAEHGWVDEEGVDMEPDESDLELDLTAADKATDFLIDEGATEPSSTQWHTGVWYSWPDLRIDGDDSEMRSYHLYGFTPAQEKEIYRLIKAEARKAR